ncbi:MAG: ribbon-helix-helix domain-containing protein [Sphingomonas ursincola]|nr:ribbon-helix-helix domain-containing protein [Sphingomonas ursincola]
MSVRLQPDQLAALDAWIEAQGGGISRPEAVRRIIGAATVKAS